MPEKALTSAEVLEKVRDGWRLWQDKAGRYHVGARGRGTRVVSPYAMASLLEAKLLRAGRLWCGMQTFVPAKRVEEHPARRMQEKTPSRPSDPAKTVRGLPPRPSASIPPVTPQPAPVTPLPPAMASAPQPIDYGDYLTLEQLAAQLPGPPSVSTLRVWARKGLVDGKAKLKTRRIGGRLYARIQDAEDFFRQVEEAKRPTDSPKLESAAEVDRRVKAATEYARRNGVKI